MATKKCMQCGGSTKKMAKGGSTTNKLNNARGYAKPQTGGSNTEKQIYGVPNVVLPTFATTFAPFINVRLLPNILVLTP